MLLLGEEQSKITGGVFLCTANAEHRGGNWKTLPVETQSREHHITLFQKIKHGEESAELSIN